MARSKELQKKLDNQWWYRLGKVSLWLIVLFTFVTGVSINGSLIDGVSGAILNFLILIVIGKAIIYVVCGKDKQRQKTKGVTKLNTPDEKVGQASEKTPNYLILAIVLAFAFIGFWKLLYSLLS